MLIFCFLLQKKEEKKDIFIKFTLSFIFYHHTYAHTNTALIFIMYINIRKFLFSSKHYHVIYKHYK